MQCFNQITRLPDKGLTLREIKQLIVRLRRSELRQSRCGKALVAYYNRMSSLYGKGR